MLVVFWVSDTVEVGWVYHILKTLMVSITLMWSQILNSDISAKRDKYYHCNSRSYLKKCKSTFFVYASKSESTELGEGKGFAYCSYGH